MRRASTNMVEVWKQAARDRLFSLLECCLTARWTRAGDGTELGEKLRSQMDETAVSLGGDSEECVLWAWRMKAIKNIAYRG